MTRKDYITLAAALNSVRPHDSVDYVNEFLTWIDCVFAVADALQADNPAFQRRRFADACFGD